MTDLQHTLLEKAHGGAKLDPDQQRKFLETFEERVLVTASLDEAETTSIQKQFKVILNQLQKEYQPLFVKLSPNLSDRAQLAYLKVANQANITATIVSNDCSHSPFGFLIHTDHAVNISETDVLNQFASLFQTATTTIPKKKTPFWKRYF